jgi:hypothetical protein
VVILRARFDGVDSSPAKWKNGIRSNRLTFGIARPRCILAAQGVKIPHQSDEAALKAFACHFICLMPLLVIMARVRVAPLGLMI